MPNRQPTAPFRLGPGPPPRAACGAKTRAGTPCRARPLPGKKRCKWHGGCSTGPRTAAGKARAVANLVQYRGCAIGTAADR